MLQYMKYDVIEKFLSINGEGLRCGHLTTFVRFKGCNLRCKYCDSAYSYDETETSQLMTEQEIVDYCKNNGAKMITLAGGEPLYRDGMVELVERLAKEGFSVEIETNGSIDISRLSKIETNRPWLTLDYKTSASGMESRNRTANYQYLTKQDSLKFVVGSKKDLDKMVEVVNEYGLLGKTNILISPVYGDIEPLEIVEYMKERKLNGYKMQIQMHKVIWDANERGV